MTAESTAHPAVHAAPSAALRSALQALLGARYVDDLERRRRYEVPERGEPGQTPAVLLPQDEAELVEILRLCNAHGGALTLSAGRTGLVEAQRPEGEYVLSLEKLKRPLTFTLADGRSLQFAAASDDDTARAALSDWWQAQALPPAALAGATLQVQAGMAVDAVNALLEPLGLMWPMEMGSTSAASVGACIANASAGANAVCYGTAAHLCEAAWGYWGDGRAAGPCAGPQWQAPAADCLAVDSASVDPAWGLIGSQGILGIVTRAALRTYARPAQREAVLLPVPDMPAAMRLLSAAQQAFPGAVEEFEFIGAGALQLVAALQGEAFRLPFASDPQAPYYVLLQLKSVSAEHDLDGGPGGGPGGDPDGDLAGDLYAFLAETLAWPEALIGYAPLPALKKLRHSITEASNARMRVLGGGRLSFDTATPVAVFGAYLAALEAALRPQQIEFIAFGHAGVGGAHLHLLGSATAPVAARATALIDTVFDITQRYGGTFSAEHGIGPKWGAAFQARTPAALRERLAAAKRQYDPRYVLNPRSFAIPRA